MEEGMRARLAYIYIGGCFLKKFDFLGETHRGYLCRCILYGRNISGENRTGHAIEAGVYMYEGIYF